MLDKISHATVDRVPNDAFGPREIGFAIPERYNASEILFRNLEAGRNEKVAVYSAEGNTTYGELCVKAAKAGNALKSLGLTQGGDGIQLVACSSGPDDRRPEVQFNDHADLAGRKRCTRWPRSRRISRILKANLRIYRVEGRPHAENENATYERPRL